MKRWRSGMTCRGLGFGHRRAVSTGGRSCPRLAPVRIEDTEELLLPFSHRVRVRDRAVPQEASR